ATTSNVSCAGGSNGNIALSVTGGTAPYSYNWFEESGTPNLFNLVAGTYTVRVEDNNGCNTTASYTITQPASPLIVNGVVVDASSSSSNDGAVTITVTGGENPYTYNWSNGATTRDISELAPGSYSVNVTDDNGCITTGIFMVGNATGLAQLGNSGVSVALYPNPATDVTTIEVSNYTISHIRIMNMNGQLVTEWAPNAAKITISTNEMSAGVYFIKVLVNGQSLVKKLTVSK
ncbi:MAG TPA: T9SS type A sorting domain-containing protein, partial [Chitinophagales bacterium]|nr:T9SS type A sorting domain-containing protein [Chitinophagales bacterium]